MPCLQYIEKTFHLKTQNTIDRVNLILDEYEKQGFDLTVRQIFYQFVSRDWLKNTMKEYQNLASIINDARLAGQVDWSRIVDRTRFLRDYNTFETPAAALGKAALSYIEDLWADQPCRIECWIEKDALVGVIEGVCGKHRIPYLSCRGYTSQSEMWGAAQRLNGYYQNGDGQAVHIIHLGDHDPSGIDMTRDITDRMDLFLHPGAVYVHRIALNKDQVRKYKPPPNPAKLTDCRATNYIRQHGKMSWELDALSPKVIAALIDDQVESLIEKEVWEESVKRETANREVMQQIVNRYDEVSKFLAKPPKKKRLR